MELLKDFATQYHDGTITNDEFMNKVIYELMNKNTELADELSTQLLK